MLCGFSWGLVHFLGFIEKERDSLNGALMNVFLCMEVRSPGIGITDWFDLLS